VQGGECRGELANRNARTCANTPAWFYGAALATPGRFERLTVFKAFGFAGGYLLIIGNFNVLRAIGSLRPLKADAPLLVDPNAVLSLPVTS